jgi:hypothetical protein
VLHAKISANRRERLFRSGIFKAEARPLVDVVNPPINLTSSCDAGSLGAQVIQLSARGPNDQTIRPGHRNS